MDRSRRNRNVVLALVFAWMIALPIPATALASSGSSDLAAFLDRAERMATFSGPVRADIRISRSGKLIDNALVIVDPLTARAFLALKSSGWRALMPLAWSTGKAASSPGGTIEAFAADLPLPGTDLRAIDFFPFWKTDYTTAFISDSTRLEKTTTLYARPGVPYVLFVITFDKEKLVPLTIKLYKDTLNNLVRLRRDSDFVMVGSRPRPRHIEIQDFSENSSTVLDIAWRTLETLPKGWMDELTFHQAEVNWPAEASNMR